MTLRDAERRPAGNGTAKENPGEKFPSSLPRIADVDLLVHRRDYAVRVFWVRADGVLVAQVYSDTKAAERKLARCMRAGRDARLELVRLVPVQPLDVEAGGRRG